jgi:hypothetical protein
VAIAGSVDDALTTLIAGGDPFAEFNRKRADEGLLGVRDEIERLRRLGQAAADSGRVRLERLLADLRQREEALVAEFHRLTEEQQLDEAAAVVVGQRVNPGVRIQIGPASLLIDYERPGGKFVRYAETGEVIQLQRGKGK